MGRLTLAIGAFILGGASLFAGPDNATVVHGHASFQSIANGIEIHSGKQTIINWDNFSIDAGEIARFCQSSSTSAVLNRVIGSEQSLINGLLTSNGHVFLLNQNGILIGKDGVIDTAGFVASALDLSNDQFLKGGDFLFKGDGKGSVINLGTIHTRGGDVFLIGYHVSNEGTIQTDGGIAGLASGGEVFLSVEGEERLYIRKEIDSEEIGASNDGVIRAAEVEIKASGNPFALAIKHGGEIEATGVAHKSGRVLLVADSGKTEVGGLVQAESGTVHVLGDEVTLTEAAAIDVSGEVGGEVLVGGDYQGANPAIPNSRGTYIYKGAEVRADGHHGDGGKVIFWGNETTHYYGDTSAAALGEVGDGGFVEVSAKSNDYIFKGPVNASSINGAKGKLLLDPPRIRVRGNPSNPAFPTTAPGTYMPVPPPNTAELFIDDIVAVLNQPNDVIIDSTSPGGGNGDIDFEASFSWNGTGNLSATAFRNITVTTGTTITSNSGNISFTGQGNGTGSQEGINLDGTLTSTSGTISLEGTSTLTGNLVRHGVQISGTGSISTGGNISITGTTRSNNSPNNSNGVFIQGSVVASGTGTLDINGTVNANLDNTSHGIEITGAVSVIDGLMTLTGATNAGGSGSNGIDVTAGSVTASGIGGITFNGTGSTVSSDSSVGVKLDSSAVVSSNSGLIDITGVGGSGVGENQGIWIGNSASVTSTTGGITMDGTGDGTGQSNNGIELSFGGPLVRSVTSGDISLTGTTSSLVSVNTDGVFMRTGSEVRSEGFGNITFTGEGLAPTIGVGEITGIDIINATVEATGTGTLNLFGDCNANSANSEGVKFQGTSLISSTTGKITVHGNNQSNLTRSHGVAFEGVGIVIQTTGGDIEISGNSTMGDTPSHGFFMPNGTISTMGSGTIEITGDIASGTGTNGQNGVEISGSGTLVATVNGDITVTGHSGGTSDSSFGVLLDNSATIESTGLGSITLDGESRATGGSDNIGVQVIGGSTLSGSGGVVSIIGIGGMGTSGNHGVALSPVGTVTSPGGLVLTGTSQDGDNSIGVLIPATVPVSALGAGNITITGDAGVGVGLNSHGVEIGDNVTTGTGNIQINGTSNGDTTSNGIAISSVDVTTTGSGQITMSGDVVSGTGTTAQNGVDLDGTSISTVDGDLSITGLSGGTSGSSFGVLLDNSATVQSTGAGNVTLDGESRATGGSGNVGVQIIGSSTLSGSGGIVSIIGIGGMGTSDNHGVSLPLGAAGTVTSPGGLVLDGTSQDGNDSSGVLIPATVTASTIGAGNITITGNGNGSGLNSHGIEIPGDVTASGSGAISIDGNANGNANAGIDISGSVTGNGGSISLTGTAISGVSSSQGINIVGSVSTTGSGTITMDGTASPSSGSASGVNLSGAMISSASGLIDITGVGGGGVNSNHGINIQSSASVTSTDGGITMMGTSGGSGSNCHGIAVVGSAEVRSINSGNINLTGLTSTGNITQSDGVVVIGGGNVISDGLGSITLTGTNQGSGGPQIQNSGVDVLSSSTVQANGTGAITITGNVTGDSEDSEGVRVRDSQITSTTGKITIDGTNASSDSSSHGVNIEDATSDVQTTSGDIEITGATANGGSGSKGVIITDATVSTNAAGTGTVTIQGTSSGSAATSPGVFIDSGSVSSGTGLINVIGTGNMGAALSEGISLDGASISATGANIQLTGTGQDTSGSPVGIAVAGGASLVTTGIGSITLSTTAGDFTDSGAVANTYDTQQGAFTLTSAGGVLFSSAVASTITTTLGSASLTAQNGNIVLDDAGTVTTGGATANLTANSGAIQLGVVNVTNMGDIFISASGQVTDNSAAPVNLIGNRGFITSGGTGPLPTTLNQFQGITPTTGSISLVNSQALELINWGPPGDAVETANNGDISITTNAGGITVTNDVVANGSGTVTLDASAGPGAASIVADVSSTSGDITVLGSSVTHAVNGNLTTGGAGQIAVTASSGNITMNPGISYTTDGGDATLNATNSAALTEINVGSGNINVMATAGTISNNSGANSPAILIGNQGTLSSGLGIGSGTSSDATAIGTDLTTLIGLVTGGSGGIIIFEQSGLDLGNISAPNGTVDINAFDLIQQVAGDISAFDALFTTRSTTIGTVDVQNSNSLILDASLAAGDLTIDVGANTLTLNGNSNVGRNYTVIAGTYDENTFTVNVGGTSNTPPTTPLSTVVANGVADDFDLSSATLATSGNITVQLRGGFFEPSPNPPPTANAILINTATNAITNSLTVTTVNPNLMFMAKDYNLINTQPISLGPLQHLIINAAKGMNFTPGVVNAKSSPFDNSMINSQNGSTINITNVGPDNVFPGWVSIRDSYTTVFEAGPDLSTEYVNTYGDLTIRTSSGAIMTGATGETMRTGGAQLTIESNGNLNIAGAVSNLTIPPVPQALNGTISYVSTTGSITGPALTQATQVKVDAIAGGIGTPGQDLRVTTGNNLVFRASGDVFFDLGGATTVIAGDSTSGSIDIETSVAGNVTIDTVTVDTLMRTGLTSNGASGVVVTTPPGGSLLIDQAVTANNSGPIQLTANGAIIHMADGDLTTAGGAITASANAGAITMDAGTVYTTAGGNAALSATADILVAQVDVGAGDVTLSAPTGAITRVAGPAVNLIGGRGYGLAQAGIGASGNILQSTLGEFQGNVTAAGDIYLNDTAGGLQLTDWNINPGTGISVQTNSGDIDIRTQTIAGNLTVTRPVMAGGAGAINLDSALATVALNQTVTSNTGSITIGGETNVTHGAAGTVTVSSGVGGTVTENAGTGDITMNASSMIVTQGGTATLTAGTNVAVSSVNVAAGDILITGATGNITRAGTGPNLIGGRAFCTSGIGVGVLATPIRSTLTEFQASVSVTGDIALQETNTINLTNWNSGINSVETNDGVIQIETQAGNLIVTQPVVSGGGTTNLSLTATTGSIVNNSGANDPEILTGDHATLTAQTGVGSGLATSATAIGTNINRLIATVTGTGDVVIFEQSAIDLGAITLNNGTLDVNAFGLIQQIPGDPVLTAADARFTTRSGAIGTADVVNGGSLTLNSSSLAGSLTIDVGLNTLTLGGNSEVGINYTVIAGAYELNGFEVNVGGTTTTPPPIVGNTVIADAAGNDFDLSTVTLPVTNPIIVQLRGTEVTGVSNPRPNNAILINGANNNIANTVTLITRDPGITVGNKDFNLTNTGGAITLNAGQTLTINAARGSNFPALGNPNDSPFDGSGLDGGNGSTVSLTNAPGNNNFPEWVSIRDAFTTTLEAGPDLSVQYVNAYGDLQLRAAAGAVTTGAGALPVDQTVRTAGANLRIDATGNINVGNLVSNLTTGGALNGVLSYATTGGSIQGAGLSQAIDMKVSAASGGIGTGGQDLQLNAGTNVAFEAANDVFLDLSGPATIIAGESSSGSIDIGTSAAGNVTIDNVTVDGLIESGLSSTGASGIQVATPPGGSILVNQGVSATSGPIQLTANGAVIHAADGDLTTTGLGTITVNANAGNLTMVDGTVYTTAGGNATLLASNSVQLAQVTTTPGGNIFVTATAEDISKVGALVNLIGNNAFCSAVTGVGAIGTPILSTLSQFQGRVTGVGDLYLVDTTGLQLTQWNLAGNSVQTINGLIDIQTQTGNLTVTNPVVAGSAGTINLDSALATVALNQTVTSNTGSITITGHTNVTHGAGGNVLVTSGAGGTVTETAATGNVTMAGTSSITTQGGDVRVSADQQIAVAAINAGAGDIFLTASNQDVIRVAGPAVNLTAGRGYGTAATGIGASGNALQSNLDQFQGIVGGTGGIFLNDTAGGLQLTNWNVGPNSADTSDGAIDIQTGAGTLTVVQPVVAGGAGTINLNANAANVLLSESVSSNTGSITITGNTNITHQALGNVVVTSGAGGIVTETATNGNLTMDGNSSIATQGGNAMLNAGSGIFVSEVNALTGNILMTATAGSISRVAGPSVNLIGGNGFASAQTGIGTGGNILQSNLDQFQGIVGVTGGIFLNDTAGGLQLTNWNVGPNSAQTNNGSIDIQTSMGSLTVVQPVVAGGSGTINLDANADVVAINQTVTSNTGSIVVTGNTGITHGMSGTVMVSSGVGGTVMETATANDITMNGNAKIITQGGNITLLADNDLNIGETNTGATGTITATATSGMITDTTTTLFLPNFVSNEVILQANTGIGSGIPSPSSTTDISTVANFLTAATVSNDIVISEATGLTLRDISTQNGGNFFLEAGGLINQDGASTLQIDGNLTVITARASTLGTVSIRNSVSTMLGESEIAGNYTVQVVGDLDLLGDQFVALDCDFNHSGNYTEAPFKVFHGGSYIVNGSDPDLQGPTINATGPTPNFDLDLAMPFSGDPVITVNLQGEIDTFINPQIADAIILGQMGNVIHGTIDIQTVDPMYQGTTTTNYNLIQTAIPFTLNAGQRLIINAVRGTANPNVSGAFGSPFSGLVNGSNLGSDITLTLANTANGTISIRDPNLCTLNVEGDPNFSHVNTFNDLTVTAPSGSITTGALFQTVRSSGSLLTLTADQSINVGAAVNALTTAGAPFGEIVYTTTNGSVTGLGTSQGGGVSFIAPLGGVTAFTQTSNCIFTAMTDATITNTLVGANFGGTVTGPLIINQQGSGDLTVNSVTVGVDTRIGLTALNQTVNLTNNAGAITQLAGVVDAGTTGTVTLNSVTGITGIGPDTTFQTLSRDVSASNLAAGEVRIENRLNGNNALSSSVMLNNGPGNVDGGRNLFFSQVGGSSVNFQTINANGTGTLLAIAGSANMNFSANVNIGGDVIAVANHNIDVAGVLFNQVTPNAVTTLVLDQESPAVPGPGTFTNAGMFNIASNNLAIYASSGPQAPANAVAIPPNQAVLGSLSALETWDQALPNGLDSKYATSYSDGGSYHGPGFGNNYTPGNGVFGSQVIWYKFDVDQLPPVPGAPTSGRIPFDPRVGINAWEVEYFLQYWNVNLNRLGDLNVPMMLIEENFETIPSIYQSPQSAIDDLRSKVSKL